MWTLQFVTMIPIFAIAIAVMNGYWTQDVDCFISEFRQMFRHSNLLYLTLLPTFTTDNYTMSCRAAIHPRTLCCQLLTSSVLGWFPLLCLKKEELVGELKNFKKLEQRTIFFEFCSAEYGYSRAGATPLCTCACVLEGGAAKAWMC